MSAAVVAGVSLILIGTFGGGVAALRSKRRNPESDWDTCVDLGDVPEEDIDEEVEDHLCTDPECSICKALRLAQDIEPMGSGDVPTVDGDLCFRCHKAPAAHPSLWCDECRPIVWGIPAEPIELQADR